MFWMASKELWECFENLLQPIRILHHHVLHVCYTIPSILYRYLCQYHWGSMFWYWYTLARYPWRVHPYQQSHLLAASHHHVKGSLCLGNKLLFMKCSLPSNAGVGNGLSNIGPSISPAYSMKEMVCVTVRKDEFEYDPGDPNFNRIFLVSFTTWNGPKRLARSFRFLWSCTGMFEKRSVSPYFEPNSYVGCLYICERFEAGRAWQDCVVTEHPQKIFSVSTGSSPGFVLEFHFYS